MEIGGGLFPLLGLIKTFSRFGDNPVQFIRDSYEVYGTVFTLPLLHLNFTFLLGPDAELTFYDERDDETLSQNEPYKFMTPIFGKGIVFDAPHAVKREQLRFIKHALRTESFKGYVPIIAEETEKFFKNQKLWGNEQEGEIDLLTGMARLTIQTATRCLLGEELSKQYGGEVSDLLHDIDEGITPLAIINPNLPTAAFRRRDAARAKFAQIFGSIIAQRRASQKNGGAIPEDMLQSFMEATYTMGELKGKHLTDDQITGMLIGVLFAGQHTSSISTTWTALKILERPELFEKIMAEQCYALGDSYTNANDNTALKIGPLSKGYTPDMDMGINKVYRMDLLHLCMREALRMYPPLIMLMRKALKPVKVKTSKGEEYTIPTGHYVFVSPAVSMNIPRPDGAFEWPQRFDPYRYIEGRDEDTSKSYAYSAFGGGTHACIGEQFGFLQVKTIVSILLRKYEIDLVDPMPTPNYRAMVVGPTQPLRIRYRLRKQPYIPRVPHEPIQAKCLTKATKTVLGNSTTKPETVTTNITAPPTIVPSSIKVTKPSEENIKSFTVQEVAKHNTPQDMWFIIDDYVYDVTEYVKLHPGGEEILFPHAGQDASEAFHGDQHPMSVRDTVKKYKIGKLRK